MIPLLIEIGVIGGLVLGILQIMFNIFKFKPKEKKNED